MKRVKLLGALLIAVFACVTSLTAPKTADAVLCCETGYLTAQYWTLGSTCAAANAAYDALARPDAAATCGSPAAVCAYKRPACMWSPENQAFKTDGQASHGCMEDCGL